MAIQIDRKRKQETRSVVLISPQGAEIEVTPTRAEMLLKRDPIGFNDGTYRKYAVEGESNVVDFKTSASAPRKGSGANTTGGAE